MYPCYTTVFKGLIIQKVGLRMHPAVNSPQEGSDKKRNDHYFATTKSSARSRVLRDPRTVSLSEADKLH